MTPAGRLSPVRNSALSRSVSLLCGGLAVCAVVAAAGRMADGRQNPGAPVGFSFANTAADAGLSSITVYVGKDTNKYLL